MTTEDPVVQSSDLALIDSDTTALTQQRLEELGRALLAFKLTSEHDSEKVDKTLKRLRQQVFWLRTSLVLTLLVIGSATARGGFWLRSQQVQLASEVTEIAQQGGPEGSFISRLGTLESQVTKLEETVPEDLPRIVETADTQLGNLSQKVDTLEQNLAQRQAITAILANALQDLVEEPPAETLIPNSSQDESSPESPGQETETLSETSPETTTTETEE